jgi:hypothetical protein
VGLDKTSPDIPVAEIMVLSVKLGEITTEKALFTLLFFVLGYKAGRIGERIVAASSISGITWAGNNN